MSFFYPLVVHDLVGTYRGGWGVERWLGPMGRVGVQDMDVLSFAAVLCV